MNKTIIWNDVCVFAYERVWWRFVKVHWRTIQGVYRVNLVFDVTGILFKGGGVRVNGFRK